MREEQPDIQLFNESGKDILIDLDTVHAFLSLLKEHESCAFSLLEVVFVDENKIVEINKEYLDRDYITDIISFRYDEDSSNKQIEGTLYCCAQRIYEQAPEHNTDAPKEFKRILIHGLLHLCGYEDRPPEAKKEMTQRENFYLDKLKA